MILGFGGIGNHLMLTPAIKWLKTMDHEIDLTVVAESKASADILAENPYVDRVIRLNPSSPDGRIIEKKAGKYLKTYQPDIFFVSAGTSPFKGGRISYFSGAPTRIGEEWRGRGFLYTQKINANQNTYEAIQNLKLAGAGENISFSPVPEMFLSVAETQFAQKWLDMKRLDAKSQILGIHPGSSTSQAWKRWGIENFIQVAKIMRQEKGWEIIWFLGPDEKDILAHLETNNELNGYIYTGDGSIRETASLINKCDLFLANDSGLRQIAIALGKKTLGIFGPTGEVKNHPPKRMNEIVIYPYAACRPCHYTGWFLSCGGKMPCLSLIEVDEVLMSIGNIISSKN